MIIKNNNYTKLCGCGQIHIPDDKDHCPFCEMELKLILGEDWKDSKED